MSKQSNSSYDSADRAGVSDAMKLTKYSNLVYVFAAATDCADRLAVNLRWHNHEVIAFSEPDELRAAIQVRQPEAVVIDIDSEPAKRVIQALAQRVVTTFPAIYVSENDTFAQRLEAVRQGAEGYFIKPLDFNALSTRIDEKISKNEVLAFRVLVVDDDEMLGSYYDAVLSSAGMHVEAISDPSKILETMKRFKPDLVLTDLLMPECNGIELAKIIRQNNRYTTVPIVFLSTETELQKQISAIETGADDFLTKPIDPEKLISAVANRAERYRSLRS
ncbi:MAG: response regulator [Burkholderiaceae bacterium]|nr:response regulator [Burkholderiaceae bacterium]